MHCVLVPRILHTIKYYCYNSLYSCIGNWKFAIMWHIFLYANWTYHYRATCRHAAMSRHVSVPVSPVSGFPTVTATISCVYCKAVLSFNGNCTFMIWLLTFWSINLLIWLHKLKTYISHTSVKSMMPPGLPAVRYADHLSQEHRILFEQVGSVQSCKCAHYILHYPSFLRMKW